MFAAEARTQIAAGLSQQEPKRHASQFYDISFVTGRSQRNLKCLYLGCGHCQRAENVLTPTATALRYSQISVTPESHGRKRQANMAHAQITGSLRRWEDLASILLGFAAIIAAVAFHPELDAILINAAVTGAVIVALAALDLTVPPHWEEPFELVAGAWLAVSPFWLGYSGPLRIVHIVIGVAVVILAAREFLQDRKNIEA